MKYFSLERIQQSSRHLENFQSGWVIVPFVFAANGVNLNTFTDLHSVNGTDALLDKYFSGDLVGLHVGTNGNALRPRFKEILSTFRRQGSPNDFAINQTSYKLWANAYSSRGYREMVGRGELEVQGTASYKLTNLFQPAFESKLPATFRFEEFMVWLFAFSGIPEGISNWTDLLAHLLKELNVPGGKFPPEFSNRFSVNTVEPVPWPNDFLSTKPTNEQYQQALLPSLSVDPVPEINESDAVLQEVRAAIDAGERNFLFYGPPGTGKTMYAHHIALMLAEHDKSRMARIQFHPSFSYDDFVEGYAPQIASGTSVVSYKLVDRHFLSLCRRANAKENTDKTFVVVIDEISRGDPSRVFGDLLTYIDKDYRDEEFHLTYSGKEFWIPDNVIIIGTTNPYDRSVAELDDAFIRRFHMIQFPPSAAVLQRHFEEAGLDGDYSARVLRLFSVLNDRMPHGFGHAYFFRIEGPEQLRNEWRAKLRFLVERSLQFDRDAIQELDTVVAELFPEPSEPAERTQ